MAKYVIEFSKRGTICYTSHLDVMRLFKRIFKRAGIGLAFSQGFNPHPKMSFAQPLSLGYEAMEEFIEFETADEWNPDEICKLVSDIMADGIDIKYCRFLNTGNRTLSAMTVAALYTARVPAAEPVDGEKLVTDYMAQDEIITLKRQKKKKGLKEVDIKPMIRNIGMTWKDGILTIRMLLDQGSTSNLSPELVLNTILPFAGMDVDRSEIAVTREKIIFEEGLTF